MRSRETITGDYNPTGAVWETRLRSNNNLVSTNLGPLGSRQIKYIDDVQTPDFHALLKCGKFLPLNPVVISTVVTTFQPGVGSFVCTSASLKYSGAWSTQPPAGFFPEEKSPPEWNNALAEAAVLAARANAASDKWDFLTFLAELRGTVDTMQQIGSLFNFRVNRLALEASRFKRNPWGRFRELWLGARYSIRPLMYDFRDAALAVDRLMSEVALIKGTGKQEETISDVVPGSWNIYGGYLERLNSRFSEEKKTYRSAAYISVDSRLDSAVSADPLVTAWELVPYSFVVDWFIDIGAWVSALTPTLRGDFTGTSWSLKEVNTFEYRTKTRVYAPFIPVTVGSCSDFTAIREFTRYTRLPYTGLPFPSLLPEITMPKLVDLVALFISGRNSSTRILNRR